MCEILGLSVSEVAEVLNLHDMNRARRALLDSILNALGGQLRLKEWLRLVSMMSRPASKNSGILRMCKGATQLSIVLVILVGASNTALD